MVEVVNIANALSSHKHSGVTAGPDSTGTPITPPAMPVLSVIQKD